MGILTVLILCSPMLYSHLGLKEQQRSVQWVNLYREHRTSPFVNSRDTQDQRGVVSLVGASCTGEKSAPLSEPSRQPAAQLSSEGIIHEQEQDKFKDEYFLTNNFYEYEQGQADIIVKDRIKSNIQFWRDIGANSYILDTIENGYVIPFHSTPVSMCCKNNRSALQHKTFVLEAISDLEMKGLVARCSEKPFIVSPLTVSVQNNGKKRLILDLRLVNKHIGNNQ